MSKRKAEEQIKIREKKQKISEENQNPNGDSFGCKVFEHLDSSKKSVLYSSLSVQQALGLVYCGVSKDSKLYRSLRQNFGIESKQIVPFYGKLNKTLVDTNKIKIANSVWHAKDVKLLDSFKETVKSIGECKLLTDQANVDKWVSQKTENMITKFPLPDIEKVSVLIMNALYFKANWSIPFDEKKNYNSYFTDREGNETEITMMNRTDKYGYFKDEENEYVVLEYESDFIMLAVLPKAAKDLPKVKNMTEIKKILGQVGDPQKIMLHFPQFTFESEHKLIEPLTKAGLQGIQDKDSYGEMVDEDEFLITGIIQKTKIVVDNKGTAAAAVTGVFLSRSCYVKIPEVVFNREFAFHIIHKPTDTEIFSGVFNNK
jgi:serine protease inhibitor